LRSCGGAKNQTDKGYTDNQTHRKNYLLSIIASLAFAVIVGRQSGSPQELSQ
jgi:hypothetical protein